MIKSCELQTKVAPSYFRNNRSTRQKSLRCFPACCLKGHVAGGFCGQALRATMTLTAEDKPINISEFLFIAEIRPLSTPRLSSQGTIRKQDLMDQIRVKNDKNSLNRELFMGEINVISTTTKEVMFDIIFNSHLSSWDYSWKSNRWSGPNERHVIDIIVLKYMSIADLLVNSFYTSSSFVIVSSHNKSTIPKEQGGMAGIGSQNIDFGQGSDDEEGYTNAHMQRSNSFSHMIPIPSSIHKTNSFPAYPDEAHQLHSALSPDLNVYRNAGMTQLIPPTNISLMNTPGSGKKSTISRKPSISESKKLATSSSGNHKLKQTTQTASEIEEDVLQASTLLSILATESVKRSNDINIPPSSTSSSSKSTVFESTSEERGAVPTTEDMQPNKAQDVNIHKRKERDDEYSDNADTTNVNEVTSSDSEVSQSKEMLTLNDEISNPPFTSFLQRKKRSKSAPVVSISATTAPLHIASDTTNTSSSSSTIIVQSQQEHRENALLLLSLLVRPNQYQYDKSHQSTTIPTPSAAVVQEVSVTENNRAPPAPPTSETTRIEKSKEPIPTESASTTFPSTNGYTSISINAPSHSSTTSNIATTNTATANGSISSTNAAAGSSNRLLANNPSMLTYQEYLAFMNHQSGNGLIESATNAFSLPPNSANASNHNNLHDLVFLPPRKPAFSLP
jgi:hypothetical protein